MAENVFKRKNEVVEEPEEIKKSSGDSRSFFQMLETTLGLNKILRSGLPIDQLPKIAFVVGLLIFYIANTHYAERVVRKTIKLKNEVEDLRADYTTLKADLMFKSKQSEVAGSVQKIELEETTSPPGKIEFKEEDLKLLP